MNGIPPLPRPPRLARRILGRIIPSRLKPTADGDFEEFFHLIREIDGPGKAVRWYWSQVVKSIPSFLFNGIYWRIVMFRSYLKTALRHMRRRPHLAAVNIGGLAVGLAGCVLASLFIRDELATDRFHQGLDRIYEVRSEVDMPGDKVSLETQGQVGPLLASSFPEVEAAVRLKKIDAVIRVGDQPFLRKGLAVDPSFFSVFSFHLDRGDPAGILQDPSSVILSRETAQQLFGDSDPVGRVLAFVIGSETHEMKVESVADIPARSSLDFGFLVPLARVAPKIDQGETDAACFIRLREGARPENLSALFPGSLDKHLPSFGTGGRHYLFPFADYHRGRGEHPFSSVLKPRSSPLFSALLSSIAALILLIAVFNFMNLSVGTAASDRVKEIGMRKVFGADRRKLFQQFRFEGVLLSLAALAGAFVLTGAILPAFNRFAEKDIRLLPADVGWILPVLAFLAVGVGIAAGSYPGWALNRNRPMELFRGTFLFGRRQTFSRTLLVLQFGISIFLVITTVFLYRQHRFLVTSDPGYDSERVAVLDLRLLAAEDRGGGGLLPVLKAKLLSHPEIQSVSGADCSLTSWSAQVVRRPGQSHPEFVRFNDVDTDYQNVLGLELKEGRWFSSEFPADASASVVVNETFAEKYAPSGPLGKSLAELLGTRSTARIIGVVRDFHYDSLHREIQPAMLNLNPIVSRWAYIRIKGNDLRQAVDIVEREFKAAAPGFPFQMSFLDQDVDRLYEKEARWSSMIGIVSLFAVLIACSGVFGLAVQITVRKRKEIGVRRVLGASVRQIAGLVNREFLAAAALAAVPAWPAAYLATRKFLSGYAYRAAPAVWIFFAGTLALAVLVALTVNLQAVRAARANPAVTLKNE